MNHPFFNIKNNCSHRILSNLLCFCRTGIVVRRYYNNYNTSLVSGIHILKEVCFMTTSFPNIHFFYYDSVIISREHLKKSICQRNCVYFTTPFATIHWNKRSVVGSRKSWRVCLFQENHCGPSILKVSIYSTELFPIIFFWRVLR